MYSGGTGIIYGFHGCDRSVAVKIINQKSGFKPSKNTYDWLGHGMYFWENSPSRAREFSEALMHNPRRPTKSIKDPCVLGAVIQLGNCLDLLDYKNLRLLKESYYLLKATTKKLPKNLKATGTSHDLMLRELDCAVIEALHKSRGDSKLREYDSVRGVFWEGKELYPNAGFREKDHVQICIRNPNCIKAFFHPREYNDGYYQV